MADGLDHPSALNQGGSGYLHHDKHVTIASPENQNEAEPPNPEASGYFHRPPPRHPRYSMYYRQVSDHAGYRSKRWSTVNNLGIPQNSSSSSDAFGCVAVDHSGAVENYFASIRVPASFLAATSFTELFAVTINREEDTAIQRNLQILCLMCQGISFTLSMNVIVLSSQALVRSLTGNFDPYAETGYEFLFREFHLEFVCTRWSFIVSLYGFLMAVTAKILYGFELFNVNGEYYDRNHLELGIGVVLIMGSLMLHLYSYVNSTLVGWNSMMHMTIDMLKMVVLRGKEKDKPLEPFSLIMACVGLIFIILAFIPGAQI